MKKSVLISLVFLLSLFCITPAMAEMNNPPGDNAAPVCPAMNNQFPMPGQTPDMLQGPGLFRGIGGITLEDLMELDLTDSQKKAVADILAANRDKYRKLVDQMADARKAFFDALHPEGDAEESAVRKTFEQMSSTTQELIVLKLKIMSALKQVLTTDQFEKITDSPRPRGKSDGHGHMGKKMDKRVKVYREMMDTWINTYADTQK